MDAEHPGSATSPEMGLLQIMIFVWRTRCCKQWRDQKVGLCGKLPAIRPLKSDLELGWMAGSHISQELGAADRIDVVIMCFIAPWLESDAKHQTTSSVNHIKRNGSLVQARQ